MATALGKTFDNFVYYVVPIKHKIITFVALKRREMDGLVNLWKAAFVALGGCVGWLVDEFEPTFPLIVVAVVLIVYDAWTAYQLDKRVKKKYPDKVKRHEAKFTSFAFGKVIRTTIPKRLVLIMLAYLVEHWVFVHVNVPLSYIVTGVICFEQAWSIMENESSCRNENESRFWRVLQKVMIDKTERHFDINLEDLKDKEDENN